MKNDTKHDKRYKSFRDEKGNYTIFFYKLMMFRFLFVLCFQHVVFIICKVIDLIIPDIPKSVENKVKREHYLAKQQLVFKRLDQELDV